ncbi:protease [Stenotrophomonas maltophilia]|nr:protease [Stenotrophomonas maltophilia]
MPPTQPVGGFHALHLFLETNMKKQLPLHAGLLAGAVALGLTSISAPAATPLPLQPARIVGPLKPLTSVANDRFIVKFKPGMADARDRRFVDGVLAAAMARSLPARAGAAPTLKVQRRTGLGAEVVSVSRLLSSDESARLLQQLRLDPAVQYAQIDRRMYPLQSLPDDPRLPSHQWDMLNTIGGIHAPGAWAESTGEGVVVAVLDTGILQHPDLDANVIAGYDMVSLAGEQGGVGSGDGDGRDADPHDPGDWSDGSYCGVGTSSWHGSHVAGTVAAVANNALGIAGAAYGAKVQPVRVLGTCGGTSSDVADGIYWAAGGHIDGLPDNPTPADVINLSLGGFGACSEDPEAQAAIDYARSRGTTVVVAAGNSNIDAAGFSPASCKGVINVGATNYVGGRAGYSNYGASVTVAAPGGEIDSGPAPARGAIWSTIDAGTQAPLGQPVLGGYQGTSMAAPHIAAIVALMQSAAVEAGRGPLTPDQVRDILVASARPFPQPPEDGKPIGAGIADAHRAVLLAQGKPLPALPIPELQNGIRLDGQSGVNGQSLLFAINVPAGATTLNLRTLGGSGDVSLYAARGAAPDVGSAPYSSRRAGSTEVIVVSRPQAGTWYVRVVGESTFRNVSVLGLAR